MRRRGVVRRVRRGGRRGGVPGILVVGGGSGVVVGWVGVRSKGFVVEVDEERESNGVVGSEAPLLLLFGEIVCVLESLDSVP